MRKRPMTRASRIPHYHDPPLRLPAAHEISLLLFDLASGCTQEGERRLPFRRRRDAAGEGGERVVAPDHQGVAAASLWAPFFDRRQTSGRCIKTAARCCGGCRKEILGEY